MKNKIQKFLSLMITVIAVSTSNAQARESYAGRGAWIGAVSGGVILAALPVAHIIADGTCQSESEEWCFRTKSDQVHAGFLLGGIALGVGAVAGAGIGALIGLAIPKHKNISVVPTFDPTPGAVGGGVNLSLNF